MKIAATIARYLLGLIFTVFGLNGFLHFIPMGGPIPPLALQFMGALMQSHYMAAVFVVEIAGGVLLLSNRYVPFALTLLGPVVVNILLFHITMSPAGLPLAAIVAVLWTVTAHSVRSAFLGLFQQRAGTNTVNA